MKYCKRGHKVTEDIIVRDRLGRVKDCRLCVRTRAIEWYYANREKALSWCKTYYSKNKKRISKRVSNYQCRKKYGISLKQRESLLKQQNGKCANKGCETVIKKGKGHLDHNHCTNEIRGILCVSCNLALGITKDNPVILTGLIEYLNKKELDRAAQT